MFRTQRRAASGLAALALLATFALAGCAPASPTGVASLDGGDGSTNSPEESNEPREGDQVKFAECMREHGIDMPDPDPDAEGFGVAIPQGTSPEEADAAIEACEEFMPGGGEPVQASPEDLAAMREFAKCMRENGIENFPDPSADGGIQFGSNRDDPNRIDPESQEFQDAEKACEDLAPKPPDGSEQEGPRTQTSEDES
jgi:hypothetical protein